MPLGTKNRRISGERYIICGDAAALIYPFGGHGIDNAVWSGIIGAQHTIQYFKHMNFSSDKLLKYDELLYKKIGARLRKGSLILKTILNVPLTIHILSVLTKFQKTARWLARVLKI